ncbi:MAG TPA: hypothetical protein VJ847_03120 [Gemmatimonadales bacterium]|nr:hypothetical protein [Gemmatimonadales bacterium]
MTGPRRTAGSSNVGCLISLLLFVAALYYGVSIGELYWRQYQLLDEMRTQARLAPTLPDPVIRRRLLTKAEELELPAAARSFRITRGGSPRQIVIETQYSDSVNLFLLHRGFVFHPRAAEPL